jgi:hypothetical protein
MRFFQLGVVGHICNPRIQGRWRQQYGEFQPSLIYIKRPCLKKSVIVIIKKNKISGCQWLMRVVLTTQEAEIRRIKVRSSSQIPYLEKNPSQESAGGVAQVVGRLYRKY